jgi:CubicO group peptidase (beta-lactamase class C family)
MDTLTSDRLRVQIHEILERHIGSTCTAAVVLVEEPGGQSIVALGRTDMEGDGTGVSASTPFDLASLTKLFTATAVLRLVASGRVSLSSNLTQYIPALRGEGTDSVSVEAALTHTSGLPAMRRLYGEWTPSGDPWDAILSCDTIRPPGSAVEYSDVGFMLLGRLVEEVTGQPLRTAMEALVLDPLGLSATYGPCAEAPATEYDPWRGRRIRGEVHDENAAVLSGAAGHAGLFGNVWDVATLARVYLHPDDTFLPRDLALRARSQIATSGTERRGLGFAIRSLDPNASEASFSEDTFGHYGFTGTAVWADPARDVLTVLLANRVYFGRGLAAIKTLRTEVFTAIADSFPVG